MKKMDKQTIYKLHQKYCHGKYFDKVLEIGWNHSLIIADIALQIADNVEKEYKIKVDKDLTELGALVHDIGFYSCFDDNYQKIEKYIKHGYLGYLILKKEKVNENVARFALVHVGVGLNKEQIIKENLDIPAKDYIPISLEEEILTYADGFHSKGHPGYNSYEEQFNELNGINKDYGSTLERFKKKFGIPDLDKISKKYQKWHKEINGWIDQVKNENH